MISVQVLYFDLKWAFDLTQGIRTSRETYLMTGGKKLYWSGRLYRGNIKEVDGRKNYG